MERIPTPENSKSLEQRVIRLFKEKGLEDKEAKELLDAWLREQEAIAEKAANYSLAVIELNIKRAGLYLAIGLREEALENLEDARVQAFQENRTELLEEINTKINKLI